MSNCWPAWREAPPPPSQIPIPSAAATRPRPAMVAKMLVPDRVTESCCVAFCFEDLLMMFPFLWRGALGWRRKCRRKPPVHVGKILGLSMSGLKGARLTRARVFGVMRRRRSQPPISTPDGVHPQLLGMYARAQRMAGGLGRDGAFQRFPNGRLVAAIAQDLAHVDLVIV